MTGQTCQCQFIVHILTTLTVHHQASASLILSFTQRLNVHFPAVIPATDCCHPLDSFLAFVRDSYNTRMRYTSFTGKSGLCVCVLFFLVDNVRNIPLSRCSQEPDALKLVHFVLLYKVTNLFMFFIGFLIHRSNPPLLYTQCMYDQKH